jgi:hypothetical protein
MPPQKQTENNTIWKNSRYGLSLDSLEFVLVLLLAFDASDASARGSADRGLGFGTFAGGFGFALFAVGLTFVVATAGDLQGFILSASFWPSMLDEQLATSRTRRRATRSASKEGIMISDC